jgi:hypothetical protein
MSKTQVELGYVTVSARACHKSLHAYRLGNVQREKVRRQKVSGCLMRGNGE